MEECPKFIAQGEVWKELEKGGEAEVAKVLDKKYCNKKMLWFKDKRFHQQKTTQNRRSQLTVDTEQYDDGGSIDQGNY